jgi:hypothetical protein
LGGKFTSGEFSDEAGSTESSYESWGSDEIPPQQGLYQGQEVPGPGGPRKEGLRLGRGEILPDRRAEDAGAGMKAAGLPDRRAEDAGTGMEAAVLPDRRAEDVETGMQAAGLPDRMPAEGGSRMDPHLVLPRREYRGSLGEAAVQPEGGFKPEAEVLPGRMPAEGEIGKLPVKEPPGSKLEASVMTDRRQADSMGAEVISGSMPSEVLPAEEGPRVVADNYPKLPDRTPQGVGPKVGRGAISPDKGVTEANSELGGAAVLPERAPAGGKGAAGKWRTMAVGKQQGGKKQLIPPAGKARQLGSGKVAKGLLAALEQDRQEAIASGAVEATGVAGKAAEDGTAAVDGEKSAAASVTAAASGGKAADAGTAAESADGTAAVNGKIAASGDGKSAAAVRNKAATLKANDYNNPPVANTADILTEGKARSEKKRRGKGKAHTGKASGNAAVPLVSLCSTCQREKV